MALPAIGFTAAGITAGSWAATMMSYSAVAAGGGVPAGGVVAVLQSAGAAGLGVGGNLGAAAAGYVMGAVFDEDK